jgi:DNA-binding GntR family transcriptional regulator
VTRVASTARSVKKASGATPGPAPRGTPGERTVSHLPKAPSPKPRLRESRGDFAYRTMRDAIRDGKFTPGEHLREADVARWLNISRTPVREAFHRIIAERLLIPGPWNGVMVADFDPQQLFELYTIREALEGTAAALAAQHASEVEIEHLFSIAEREAAKKADPDRLVIINAELHQTIYGAAHNRFLLQSLNTIVDALGLLRHSTFVLPGSIATAHREHLEIIKAIHERNPKRAERTARLHVRHSLALRLQLHRSRV